MKKLMLLMMLVALGWWLWFPNRRNRLEIRQEQQPPSELMVNPTTESLRDEGDFEITISESGPDQTQLSDRIRTFINLYYDWTYGTRNDLALQDYVTISFFENRAKTLIDVPFTEGDMFGISDVWVTVHDLELYTPFLHVGDHFDVIVTFHVFYDIPNNAPFTRTVALKLAVQEVHGHYYIDNKIVISSQ